MATLIGTVEAFEGTFFIEDKNGSVRELKVGDEIHQGDRVFGDASNTSEDFLQLQTVTLEEFVLSGTKSLAFDTSTNESTFGNEETDFVDASWLSSIEEANQANEDVANEETATGEEEAESSDGQLDGFLARDGELVNIESNTYASNTLQNTQTLNEDLSAISDDNGVFSFDNRDNNSSDIGSDLNDKDDNNNAFENDNQESGNSGNNNNNDNSSTTLPSTTTNVTINPVTEDDSSFSFTIQLENSTSKFSSGVAQVTITLPNGDKVDVNVNIDSNGQGSYTYNFSEDYSDVFKDDNGSVKVEVTDVNNSGLQYENFTGDFTSQVILDTTDITTLTLSTTTTTVTEGGTIQYTLALSNPTQTDMKVTVVINGEEREIIIPQGESSVSFTTTAPLSTTEGVTDAPFTATIKTTTGGNFEKLETKDALDVDVKFNTELTVEDIAINEDSVSVTGNASATDVNTDDVLSYSVEGTTANGYGTVTINPNTGEYVFKLDNTLDEIQQLNEGGTLTDTFTVTVDDGNGGVVTKEVTVTINGTNDAPTLEVKNLEATTDDLTVKGQAIATDVDNDSFDLTFSVENGLTQNGMFTINAETGEYTYTLFTSAKNIPFGEVLTEEFVVKVSDGEGGVTEQTVTITVTGTDDVPTISEDTGARLSETQLENGSEYNGAESVTATGSVELNYGANGKGDFNWDASGQPKITTPDGTEIKWTVDGDTLKGIADGEEIISVTMNTETGEYTVEMNDSIRHDEQGKDVDNLEFKFTITDADDDSAFGSVNVTVEDDAPANSNSEVTLSAPEDDIGANLFDGSANSNALHDALMPNKDVNPDFNYSDPTWKVQFYDNQNADKSTIDVGGFTIKAAIVEYDANKGHSVDTNATGLELGWRVDNSTPKDGTDYSDGIGMKGQGGTADYEVGNIEGNYTDEGVTTEALILTLPEGEVAYGVDLSFGCLFGGGSNSADANDETITIEFFKDGVLVHTVTQVVGTTDGNENLDTSTITGGFDEVRIIPDAKGSDFVLNGVDFSDYANPVIAQGSGEIEGGADGIENAYFQSIGIGNSSVDFTLNEDGSISIVGENSTITLEDGTELTLTVKNGVVIAEDSNGNDYFTAGVDNTGSWTIYQHKPLDGQINIEIGVVDNDGDLSSHTVNINPDETSVSASIIPDMTDSLQVADIPQDASKLNVDDYVSLNDGATAEGNLFTGAEQAEGFKITSFEAADGWELLEDKETGTFTLTYEIAGEDGVPDYYKVIIEANGEYVYTAPNVYEGMEHIDVNGVLKYKVEDEKGNEYESTVTFSSNSLTEEDLLIDGDFTDHTVTITNKGSIDSTTYDYTTAGYENASSHAAVKELSALFLGETDDRIEVTGKVGVGADGISHHIYGDEATLTKDGGDDTITVNELAVGGHIRGDGNIASGLVGGDDTISVGTMSAGAINNENNAFRNDIIADGWDISSGGTGGNDTVNVDSMEGGRVVGDSYYLHGKGGDDTIDIGSYTAKGFGATYVTGDSYYLYNGAQGGNDTINIDTMAGQSVYGDAYSFSGIGGNDTINVQNMESGSITGDGSHAYGTSVAGDDTYNIENMSGGIIYGDSATDYVGAKAGDDTINIDTMSGGTIYADSIYGVKAGGDDTISINTYEDGTIDAGAGYDKLELFNTSDIFGEDIAISNFLSNTKNIEELDLSNYEGNKISLSLEDVVQMTDSNNEIKITGLDLEDKVELDASEWSQGTTITETDGTTYNVYTGVEDPTVCVKIQTSTDTFDF